jgi:hypothetical protein
MDQSPEYQKRKNDWEVLECDDKAIFMGVHGKHELEELQIIEESLISHQDYSEPLRTSFFEATNGRERFVIKKTRESILDAYRYEAVEGKLLLKPGPPSIDRTSIEKEFGRASDLEKIEKNKIKYFIDRLEQTVSLLNPQALEKAAFESHNPSIWYFFLNEDVLDQAFTACSQLLSQRDRQLLAEYVRQNLDSPLFMASVRVDFQVEPKPGQR